MIELHSHILPNIDDGPSTISQFLEMVNLAVNVGITRIFATPHHMNGKYENRKESILMNVSYYNRLIQNEGLPLIIYPGQELRIHLDIFNSFKKDEILTLGNKGKYLLLELPSFEVPNYTYEVVYELLLKGITPIIVHPERNKELHEEPNLIVKLIQAGALTQLTAGSILGHFGKKVKSFSRKLIEHNLVHFISSDAHNNRSRSFFLQDAYDAITNEFGFKYTFYFRENTELLFIGQSVQVEEPIRIKGKIFGIF